MTRWSEGVNWGSINVAGSMLVVEVDLRRVYQKVNRPKRENVAKSGRDRRRSGHVCHVLPRDIMPGFCRGAVVPCRLAMP